MQLWADRANEKVAVDRPGSGAAQLGTVACIASLAKTFSGIFRFIGVHRRPAKLLLAHTTYPSRSTNPNPILPRRHEWVLPRIYVPHDWVCSCKTSDAAPVSEHKSRSKNSYLRHPRLAYERLLKWPRLVRLVICCHRGPSAFIGGPPSLSPPTRRTRAIQQPDPHPIITSTGLFQNRGVCVTAATHPLLGKGWFRKNHIPCTRLRQKTGRLRHRFREAPAFSR